MIPISHAHYFTIPRFDLNSWRFKLPAIKRQRKNSIEFSFVAEEQCAHQIHFCRSLFIYPIAARKRVYVLSVGRFSRDWAYWEIFPTVSDSYSTGLLWTLCTSLSRSHPETETFRSPCRTFPLFTHWWHWCIAFVHKLWRTCIQHNKAHRRRRTELVP